MLIYFAYALADFMAKYQIWYYIIKYCNNQVP